jgi:hypothetical protein
MDCQVEGLQPVFGTFVPPCITIFNTLFT